MSAEHLLDALGLLDDDLIQEAERYRRPKAKINYRVWLSLAACFAVILGYGIIRQNMGGGNSAAPENFSGGAAEVLPSASGGQVDGELLPPMGDASGPGEGDASNAIEPSSPDAAGNGALNIQNRAISVSLWRDDPENRYTFFHRYGEDRVLDQLPKGCVSLGELEGIRENEEPNVPYTGSEEYIGCPVWLLSEGPVWKDGTLYVELPEGGYLECR